jgi:hypothetical protein
VSDQVLQIVPAAAGWRRVFAYTGCTAADLEAAPDKELFYEVPIACFALVEQAHDRLRVVRPVCPEDWPEYLWIEDDDPRTAIGYLPPGVKATDDYRKEAIHLIEQARARQETVA